MPAPPSMAGIMSLPQARQAMAAGQHLLPPPAVAPRVPAPTAALHASAPADLAALLRSMQGDATTRIMERIAQSRYGGAPPSASSGAPFSRFLTLSPLAGLFFRGRRS